MKIFCKNKKAYFNYEISEKFEAGIELKGEEIKLLVNGKADLTGTYAKFLLKSKKSKPELFLIGARIGEGENAVRSKKLLMHRAELNRLVGKLQQKNLSLVPTMIYGKNGVAKVELGLAKGKKEFSKKEVIKNRDIERQIESELKNR